MAATLSPVTGAATGPFSPGSICYKPYVCDGAADLRIDDLLAQTAKAEEAGFDGVTISEHHLGFPGYFPNPLQAASWMLECSSRVWVAPAPLLVLLRPLNLVVEELAWLAARYPGRVGAGFAAGALAADFELAGTTQDNIAARFETALGTATKLLGGDVSAELAADPALALLRERPIPTVSAASSHTACRRAARVGSGILLESAVSAHEVAAMVRTYREAGGNGPVVLVRRVWVGADPPIELESQRDSLVRSAVPVYNRDSWLAPDKVIISGAPEELASELSQVADRVGADVLNLRVHVPGLPSSDVLDQIAALRHVLPHVRIASAANAAS